MRTSEEIEASFKVSEDIDGKQITAKSNPEIEKIQLLEQIVESLNDLLEEFKRRI